MARATRDEDLDVREFDAGVLNDFLREKDVVEGYIGEIVDYTDKTHHLVDETNAAFDPAKEAEISTSLVRVSKAASAIAKKAKVALDKMQAEGKKMQKQYGAEDRTYQVYKMHYDRLVKKYVDAVKAYQKAKSQAVDAGKATLTRRAHVFFPNETDEQIEKRIEDNPLGFAREALQREEANEQVQQAYRDVTTRAREVEQLANSIREVYEMFQDFATLVAQQHEQIDSIETTIEQAAQRVQRGNEQLVKAIEYQKKIRKKYCCIAVVVVVVLCILAGVFGGLSKRL